MTAGEVDYYGLDELLGEEERMTRASVRSFVEREVLPVIERCHSEEQFPRPLIARMGELGFFGANLKGYGCAGLSNGAYGLIMQELEAGDSGLRSMASVQGSLAMFAIWRWGSEEQKERWLPEMARGRAIGCFGLTEPDHGSDPGGMETRARRDGSGYVLSGVKRWITNGSIADVSSRAGGREACLRRQVDPGGRPRAGAAGRGGGGGGGGAGAGRGGEQTNVGPGARRGGRGRHRRGGEGPTNEAPGPPQKKDS